MDKEPGAVSLPCRHAVLPQASARLHATEPDGALAGRARGRVDRSLRLSADERQRLLLPTQAVPLLAIALVIPDMRLTPPEKGWRVKNHPAAVAIDALTLASRAPSIVYEVNRPRWLGLGIGLGLNRTSSP